MKKSLSDWRRAADDMIANTKRHDPMAPYVEKPKMLPRVSLTEDGVIRMPYIGADEKQRCIIIGSEKNLNYLELSIIEVREKLAQRRIDEINRIPIP
jgi:hypothetical protein